MSSFQVRPATLRDVQAIAQVHAAASQAAYQDLVPAEALNATPMEKRQAFWRDAVEYGEPQAVSYTHLDVYKRQGQFFGQQHHRRHQQCRFPRAR